MRILINGFGRIGRTVLRAWALSHRGARAPGWPMLQIIGINDIAAPETCAHLFEFDSVFGPYPGKVAFRGGRLLIDDKSLRLTQAADLGSLDLSDIDLVMECTGRADSPAHAAAGLSAGAARVLISGPSSAAEVTMVLGANDSALGASQKVISNASCTTNALAPLVALVDREWGLEGGWMTTIHCYTGSQPSVDAPRDDLARARAAALSMVPTTTSAGKLLDKVLPDLAGRIACAAVRVPTASVSAIDLCVTTRDRPEVKAINAALREAAAAAGSVIGCTDKPLVSTDLRARAESVVMALPETRVTPGGMLRLFGWYDNEWGYSNRMLDMAARLASI